MKKIILIPLISLIITSFSGCSVLRGLGLIPTELEMIMGLKDALQQGLFRGFDAFANPEGNPLIRFVFPGEAEKIEKTLRDIGLDRAINQVTSKFNRAMSTAVQVSKPLFIDAIKNMSIREAVNILVTDNPHAATEYFKKEMKPGLMDAFRPIVDSTIKTEGANKEWSNIVKVYNKIPFISKPLEENLTDFIAARAVDGMFLIIANEEEQIRTRYELRKTDMMRKVFTWAEKELQRRQMMKTSG
ncbi:MAG: DUF4197 domain-containing protein [Chitinophagaceae bacterium]|nr:DUF4197 domain-containing protein [Chitinophagaceae bacterium]